MKINFDILMLAVVIAMAIVTTGLAVGIGLVFALI